jgi:hypothetical protein
MGKNQMTTLSKEMLTRMPSRLLTLTALAVAISAQLVAAQSAKTGPDLRHT